MATNRSLSFANMLKTSGGLRREQNGAVAGPKRATSLSSRLTFTTSLATASLRRIRVLLDKPTRDGDREITILSNLPASTTARQIATGYRQRWTVETAFAVIQKCLEGEISGLGYPRAALFSYAVALFAFNVLSLLRTAMRAVHGKAKIEQSFSTHHMAEEIPRCGPA